MEKKIDETIYIWPDGTRKSVVVTTFTDGTQTKQGCHSCEELRASERACWCPEHKPVTDRDWFALLAEYGH